MSNKILKQQLIGKWKSELSNKKFIAEILVSITLLIVSLISLTNFLHFNELREGFAFTDPFLNLYNPINLTWLTFFLIYSALLTALIYLLNHPELIIKAFLSYSFTILIRILAMYSLPLNPPSGMIPLEDPFVQLFGSGETLLKDLFFSGHTSTLFLLFLVVPNKTLKKVFVICTILVALCVLLQHVHYTIDVLAAPFFAYGSFKFAEFVINYFGKFIPSREFSSVK